MSRPEAIYRGAEFAMDVVNSGETRPRRRASWLRYVVGAVAGALLTLTAVALLGGNDSDTEPPATSATTRAPSTTATSTTAPPSTTGSGAGGEALAIVSFGVSSTNCPPGAQSTTVVITYQTTGATSVDFTVDNGAPSPAPDTSGSRDVGPIPCDARPHVVTLIAQGNGQRATRKATVSVS
jgi:hypothetical protein